MCQTEGLVCVEPARSWEGRVEVTSHAEPRVKSCVLESRLLLELEAGLCPLQPLNLCFLSSGSKVIADVSGEEVVLNQGGLNRVCVPRKRALDTHTHKDNTEVSSG